MHDSVVVFDLPVASHTLVLCLAVHQAVTTKHSGLHPNHCRRSRAAYHSPSLICALPPARNLSNVDASLGERELPAVLAWPLPAASLFSSNPSHLIPSVHPSTTSTQPPSPIIPDHPKAQKHLSGSKLNSACTRPSPHSILVPRPACPDSTRHATTRHDDTSRSPAETRPPLLCANCPAHYPLAAHYSLPISAERARRDLLAAACCCC